MKPVILFVVVFVVVSGAMYFVCANSHIDIFPCTKVERDFNATPGYDGELPLTERSGTCSVLGASRPPYDGAYEELTGLGWALVALFCGGIGAAVGGVAFVIAKKKTS